MERTRLIAKANVFNFTKEDFLDEAIPNISMDQVDPEKDLIRMVSILVSTGINKNDDVFLKEELVPARSTGTFKPVNIEHDETQIIGTITKTFISDKNGQEISEEDISQDSNVIPEEFDITNESVIYAFLFPKIADEIKARAEAGNLFVSIEAWFTSFDFLIENKIVARNNQTAPILDNTLKINGGDGTFRGMKVGRVLRDIVIGGMGVVENPANPESVIKSVASLGSSDVNISDTVIAKNIIGEIGKVTANTKEEELEMDKVLEELKELVKATNLRNEEISIENKKLLEKVQADERKELSKVRASELSDKGFSKDFIEQETERVVAMTKDEFNIYKDFLVNVVNSVDKGKVVKELIESQEAKESQTEASEEVAVDLDNIEPVDKAFVVESNETEKDLVDQMTDALTPFLVRQNPRWAGLKSEENS